MNSIQSASDDMVTLFNKIMKILEAKDKEIVELKVKLAKYESKNTK